MAGRKRPEPPADEPAPMGRPPRAGVAAERRVTIRLTEEEHALWTERAGDKPLGQWLREIANRAARR
jgi:hypothetical protein